MFQALGLNKPVIEPLLDKIYKLEEKQIWKEDLQNSPHGEPWHTSFHASSFPGDDPKACGRKELYSLMNIPSVKPIDRAGRAVMEAGKDIEETLVWRFHRAGILLTESPDAEFQQGFTDSEHWLTGSPDCVILTPKLRPYPIEVKTKDHDVIQKMRTSQKSYDASHRKQALTYIGFSKEEQPVLWPKYKDVTAGGLYYVSRNRPHFTHEYKFEYDAGFMEQGRAKLAQWRDSFLEEKLPPRDKSWKWTDQPCKWCPVKPVCKADVKDKVTKLSESNALKHAEEVRGSYDYSATRKKVLDRWT